MLARPLKSLYYSVLYALGVIDHAQVPSVREREIRAELNKHIDAIPLEMEVDADTLYKVIRAIYERGDPTFRSAPEVPMNIDRSVDRDDPKEMEKYFERQRGSHDDLVAGTVHELKPNPTLDELTEAHITDFLFREQGIKLSRYNIQIIDRYQVLSVYIVRFAGRGAVKGEQTVYLLNQPLAARSQIGTLLLPWAARYRKSRASKTTETTQKESH